MFLFFLYTCSDWYRLCFRNCVVWMGSRWCNRITFIPSQREGVQTFLLGLVQISFYGWQNIITVFRQWYIKLLSLSSVWRQSMSFVYLSILKFSVSAHHITDKNLQFSYQCPYYFYSLKHRVIFLKKELLGSGHLHWCGYSFFFPAFFLVIF